MNNRTIKFRVWSEEENLFINEGEGLTFIDLAEFESVNKEDCVYIFQQFTGLKDKNGREIYEGDIVKYGIGMASESIAKVEFWQNLNSFRYILSGNHINWDLTRMEIIGNIIENPELNK